MSSTCEILVDGRPVAFEPGSTLFAALTHNAVRVLTACGGRGNCHLCRVTITDGRDKLPPPGVIEKRALGNVLLGQGMRLSCQVPAIHGVSVAVPHYETPEERRERVRLAREKKEST